MYDIPEIIGMSDEYVYHTLTQHSIKNFMQERSQLRVYITDLPECHCKTGIELLEKCWTECVKVAGDNTEKLSHLYNNHLFFHFRSENFQLALE